MLTRRSFLSQISGAAPLCLLAVNPLARALAAAGHGATRGRALVAIHLRGGNDGLNTVVPVEDDRYHRARPTLAVRAGEGLPLGSGQALHPALAGLKELFDSGRLAILNGVGYPHPDRSHFRSTDVWYCGDPEGEARRSGVLGRAADELRSDPTDLPAVAVADDALPLLVVGERTAAPVIPSFERFLLEDESLAPLLRSERPRGAPLLDLAAARTAAAAFAAARVREAARASRAEGLPRSALGNRLATVLTLMRADLGARLFFVAQDGYDTHVRQKDAHAALLRELGDAVLGFANALGRDGDERGALVLVFSEFGRRVAENGSLGTDHGAAAPVFVAGSSVAGGLYGGAPDLGDLDDGDLRHGIDFRSVYATLLESWFLLDSARVLGKRFPALPFLPRPA